jgi:dTDP-4-amino-4,6-dideoxygalactose transaminase
VSAEPLPGAGLAARFARPRTASAGDALEVRRALLGPVSGTAPIVEEYEAALARFLGAPGPECVVAVSSGSTAVMAALAAVGVSPGDEVVLTPTCPLCTVYPVMSSGATPVFCDTQAESFSADLADLERAIGPRTAAIVEIPMWGYPTPVEPLAELASARGIPLILDLALALGTRQGGRPLWQHGDVATFSTHESKLLTTGEGGFVVSRDADLAARARSFRQFGHLAGAERGLNLKLGALPAALGLARLRDLAANLAERRSNAAILRAGLSGGGIGELSIPAGGEPNYLTFLLRLPTHLASAWIDHLYGFGIPSDLREYPCRPLHQFPILRRCARPTPNAARLLASITTLPVHPGLGEADLLAIVDAVRCFPGAP